MRVVVVLFFLFLHAIPLQATTWAAALPYTQQIEGQQIIIKAKAYWPYAASPYGETAVYNKKELLYTIDRYFRGPVYTSNDGIYLVAVATNNYTGVTSTVHFGQNWINYNAPAITIYKNGRLFKVYRIRDVVDTTLLLNDGVLYDWGYSIDWGERVQEMQYNCDACIKTYGKKALASCDTEEIEPDECKQCNSDCDSVALFRKLLSFVENSVYVEKNVLHVITNQNKIILLDFKDLSLGSVPLNGLDKDFETFDPPKRKTEYDTTINLPDKFAEPTLLSGENLDTALARYLGIKLARGNSFMDGEWSVFLRRLVINTHGLCEELDMDIWDQNGRRFKSRNLSTSLSNKQLKEKIEKWFMLQHYNTDLIPKGFKKYSFYTFLEFRD